MDGARPATFCVLSPICFLSLLLVGFPRIRRYALTYSRQTMLASFYFSPPPPSVPQRLYFLRRVPEIQMSGTTPPTRFEAMFFPAFLPPFPLPLFFSFVFPGTSTGVIAVCAGRAPEFSPTVQPARTLPLACGIRSLTRLVCKPFPSTPGVLFSRRFPRVLSLYETNRFPHETFGGTPNNINYYPLSLVPLFFCFCHFFFEARLMFGHLLWFDWRQV